MNGIVCHRQWRYAVFPLLQFIPLSLPASEIQHVLGGAFQALMVAIFIAMVLYVLLPALYYFTRNRVLAYILFLVGGVTCLLGLWVAMSGSGGDPVVLGMAFMLAGVILIRLPIKRNPL